MTDATADTSDARCANCGATLAGAYCSACGQSADTLNRGFFALMFEQLGDLFDWDGRLLTTLRQLFTRPGQVAREFVAGKRASHTPPVRLLLLASLALFAVMSAFGMRIVAIAVDSGVVAAGEDVPLVPKIGATVTIGEDAPLDGGTAWAVATASLFGGDQASRLTPASPEVIAALEGDNDDRFEFAYDAFRDPAGLERAVNAAATQALFSMVAVFALLNLLLHPRRPFLLHATHALYFHAALALVFAVWIAIARLASLSPEWTATPPLLIFLLGMIAFDRGCYGTSAPGLVLRIPVLLVGYLAAAVVVVVGFIVLLIPR